MFNRLELVINIQLRSHFNKSENVDETDQSLDDIRVPALMLFIDQGVNGITNEQRNQEPNKVLAGSLIMFLSGFLIRLLIVNFNIREFSIFSFL